MSAHQDLCRLPTGDCAFCPLPGAPHTLASVLGGREKQLALLRAREDSPNPG